MFRRVHSAGLRVLREAASAPLRMLSKAQRRRAWERLDAEMITDVKIAGGALRFMTSTPLLHARASAILSKEPDTICWIDGFKASDVFWDVGANVGVFSLYAAGCRGLRVLAFEPSADNYMVLCRNVTINSLSESISTYCMAFSDDTRLGTLNLASLELGAALHQFGQAGAISRWSEGGNVGRRGWLASLSTISLACLIRHSPLD